MCSRIVLAWWVFAVVAVRPCVAAGDAVSFQTLAYVGADARTNLFRAGERVIAHQPDADHGRVLHVMSGDTARAFTVGLGQAGGDERGRATFEVKAVAALPDGEVLLYVAPLGRADVGGLWRWRPGNEPARRVLSTRDVADASGFGTQLALAEAQMAAAGGDVWVMLRSPDAVAGCRLDARRLDGSARLTRAFGNPTVVNPADGDATLPIERRDVWTGRPDGTLTLFRPSRGEAWRVDTNGRATPVAPAPPDAGETPLLPQNARPLSTVPPLDVPTIEGPRVLRFHPDAPRLSPPPGEGLLRYPVLLLGDGKTDTTIARDAIGVRPGFPVHAMHLTAWCVDAAGSVVAYDAMSGEVFRLNPAK